MNPIREAVNRLPGHWHKGYYFDKRRENFCGLGIVAQTIGKMHGIDWTDVTSGNNVRTVEFYRDQCDAWSLLNQIAGEQYPDRTDGSPNFPLFNDHKDTTEEEVVALLEKAAVRWDEKHG